MALQEQFQINIERLLSHSTQRVLLAVSGGVDSMVMLQLFSKTKIAFGVAHCNFQLRAQANEEEQFVQSICEQIDIPFYSNRFATKAFAEKNGISIQMAARNLRYEWLNTISEQHNYSTIATAHHSNDSLETTLLNLTKGTGIQGITGIQMQNKHLIRPLLTVSKVEIIAYAKENSIPFKQDESNATNVYERNTIRNKVIPVLKELNPSLEQSFVHSQQNLEFAALSHQKEVERLKRKLLHQQSVGTVIHLPQLVAQPFAEQVFYELIKSYSFTPQQSATIFQQLPSANSGAEFFSITHRMVKDRNRLIIDYLPKESSSIFTLSVNQQEVKLNKKTLFQKRSSVADEFTTDKWSIQVDAEQLAYPLVIRKWMPGDYFYPLGLGKKQKLKKFFINEKLSIPEKEAVWLLVSNEKIVWVIGHRIDHRFRLQPKTTEVVKFWVK